MADLLIYQLSQWDWLYIWCFFEVESCDPLEKPDHGSLMCNHPLENFSYNSSCTVQCEEGYELTALESVYCTSSGVWSAPLAACKGELSTLYVSLNFSVALLVVTNWSSGSFLCGINYMMKVLFCCSMQVSIPEEVKWTGWVFWPWSRFPCRGRLSLP